MFRQSLYHVSREPILFPEGWIEALFYQAKNLPTKRLKLQKGYL